MRSPRSRRRPTLARVHLAGPLALWLAGPPAFAEAPAAAAPAPATAPGSVPQGPTSGGGATSAPTSGAPGPAGAVAPGVVLTGRLGEGQAGIVAGNVASARERALSEAFKRAVDAAIDTLGLASDVRTAQPKLVVQVLGRARAFVRRYRTLDEGERAPGTYAVRIDAEVDDAALRRALEKAAPSTAAVGGGASSPETTGAPGSGSPASGPAAGSPPSYLVVGSGAAGAEAAAAVAKALAAAGARVRAGTTAETELPDRALQAATHAQLGAVAFVTGTASSEGRVRGPGLESVSCAVDLRIVQSGTGLPLSDESENARSFAEREDAARADCLGRAVAAVVTRAAPQGSDARGAPGLRTVTIDAEVVEPGAVLALLKQLRGLGPVSGADLRSITAGHVELQVRSRLPGAALTALATRDTSVLDWSTAEVTGDLVRARVRLRSNEAERMAPPEGGGEPGGGEPTLAGTAGGGTGGSGAPGIGGVGRPGAAVVVPGPPAGSAAPAVGARAP